MIINTHATVEHDSIVEDGASISPGVHSAGRVRIGRGAFVSTGATLASRVSIGAEAIVGAGAIVMHDVRPGMLVYGAPAREIRVARPEDWQRLW